MEAGCKGLWDLSLEKRTTPLRTAAEGHHVVPWMNPLLSAGNCEVFFWGKSRISLNFWGLHLLLIRWLCRCQLHFEHPAIHFFTVSGENLNLFWSRKPGTGYVSYHPTPWLTPFCNKHKRLWANKICSKENSKPSISVYVSACLAMI